MPMKLRVRPCLPRKVSTRGVPLIMTGNGTLSGPGRGVGVPCIMVSVIALGVVPHPGEGGNRKSVCECSGECCEGRRTRPGVSGTWARRCNGGGAGLPVLMQIFMPTTRDEQPGIESISSEVRFQKARTFPAEGVLVVVLDDRDGDAVRGRDVRADVA